MSFGSKELDRAYDDFVTSSPNNECDYENCKDCPRYNKDCEGE